MLDSLLISYNDFAPYTDINSNIDKSKKLDPFIRQAQYFDLKEVLGDKMFYSLVEDFESSPSLPVYSNLMNGSTYQISGTNYRNPGLIPVLCYFTYSRYVLSKQSNDTAYGLVHKKNEFSELISEKELNRLADNARSIAAGYMVDVLKFLNNINPSYPIWSQLGCNIGRNKMSTIISSVG